MLMAFGFDLSVIAIVGILLLIGIVKKNGIMMIDFALHAEREQGLTPEEAIYQACIKRFRPILMTTMAAMLGAVPLMLGTGTGTRAARLRHRRRIGAKPVLDALHHAGRVPISRSLDQTAAPAVTQQAYCIVRATPGRVKQTPKRAIAAVTRQRNAPPRGACSCYTLANSECKQS